MAEKLICFSVIVLQKVSATNFAGKKKKKKGKKNREIHKKFINNKIHKKLILILEFFSSTIAKNATKGIYAKHQHF